MKKILSLSILLLIVSIVCFSCGNGNHHDKHKKRIAKSVKIKRYRQRSSVVDNNPMNDWIFWYLIMHNNGSCSYYSSTTPISNYGSVNWSKSEKVPEELEKEMDNKENVQEQQAEQVEVDDLSNEMQAEIDATPENYEGMTYDELGDYEGDGGTSSGRVDDEENDNSESNESSDNGSDSGSDSGGDSGGGDSGGGDGGGGDGGGGGD